MSKRLVFLFILLCSVSIYAQENKSIITADSITYKYYLEGDWGQLIATGEQALNQNIDFKTLRQRIGYAYFMKGDFYESRKHYEKALAFDNSDATTLLYLYYNGLNLGDMSYANYYASKLPLETRQYFKLKPFKIINSFDLEYNHKTGYSNRFGPTYIRMGMNTQLGYKLNLYQSVSDFTQKTDSSSIRQTDYFALMSWTVNSHLLFSAGYHYINTNVISRYSYNEYSYGSHNSIIRTRVTDTVSTYFPGHLFFSKLSYSVNRFDFAVNGSVLKYDSVYTQQYGIQAGVTLPGKANVYLKSSLYGLFDSNLNSRLIFSQSAGALFFKKLWLEGDVVLGNQNYFADNNGLYVYNSLDPTTFKAGISLFWYLPKNITLYTNYTFDNKYISAENQKYAQHSITGGIIWKL